MVARRCTQATRIKNIDIPLDLAIAVDVLSIHYDAQLWGPVDPKQFYPSRFSPEHKRNPLAFVAFGLGPRNCNLNFFNTYIAKTIEVLIDRKMTVIDNREYVIDNREYISIYIGQEIY